MSRVKKFKDYRNSLQNNSEDVFKTQPIDITKDIDDERLTQEKPSTESLSTLTVSYDEIMEAANEAESNEQEKRKLEKKARNLQILKISGIVFGCLVIAGAIIAIGIILFK